MTSSEYIEAFATKIKEDLQANLQKKLAAKSTNGHDGMSRLSASIRLEYYKTGKTIYGFKLFIDDYYYWVNKGREPGGVSREGQAKIAAWVKSRGLKPTVKALKTIKNKQIRKAVKQISEEKKLKSVVYLISRKLKTEGYKPTFFYDEVVNDGRLKDFVNEFMELFKKEIEFEIVN